MELILEIKTVDYFHEATLWLTDSSPAYHLCITETGMSSSDYTIVDTLVVHLTKEFHTKTLSPCSFTRSADQK